MSKCERIPSDSEEGGEGREREKEREHDGESRETLLFLLYLLSGDKSRRAP